MDRAKVFLINKNKSIKDAIRQMKEIGEKELFIVDEKNKLYGVLSDGDIRKWILSAGNLDAKIDVACNKKPIVVDRNYKVEKVKKIMLDLKIEVIPVVENGDVIDVISWDNVFMGQVKVRRGSLNLPVVIMAGGKGVRLDPFTRILPKPLIPLGEKPVIEVIMDKFADYAVKEFYISVGHKYKMIKSYFEDMNEKYKVHFIEEEVSLGTVGSLRLLLDKVKGSIVVVNCDTIINSDYNELVKFHCHHQYDLTLVVSLKHYVIPFGVCEVENGGILKEIKEKPEYDLLVNTGMYIIESDVLHLIPPGVTFDIVDLIHKAKAAGYRVGAFPVGEKSWIDIGQWEEYRQAVAKITVS